MLWHGANAQMISVAMLLLLGRISQAPHSKPACDYAAVVRSLAAVNRLSWRKVTIAEASKVFQEDLSRIDSPCPTEAVVCEGTVELTNQPARPQCSTISVTFSLPPTGIERVSVMAAMSFAESMLFVSEVREALKAGGKPSGTDRDFTYEWRSRDSTIHFQLVMRIEPLDTLAELVPDSAVRVHVRLHQQAANPADVDLLPFERGTFLAPCK
jgi:hypothetical protein